MSRISEAEDMEALQAARRHGFGIKGILNKLGGTLADAGKLEEAIPFFKDALEPHPHYELALRDKSNAFFSSRRYREATKRFDRAIEVDPSNPVAQLGKARAHKELGEKAAAYFGYLHLWQVEPRNETLRVETEESAKAAYGEKSPLAKLTPPPRPRPPASDPFEDFQSLDAQAPEETSPFGTCPPGAAWVPQGSAVQIPSPR